METRTGWTYSWGIGLVLSLAAALRLAHLDLMEFKSDEATAVTLALESFSSATPPAHGLMSSVGIYNPPVFIDLLLLPGLFSLDPIHLTQFIALLNVGAVFLCYWFGCRIFNARVGLASALLFAASPWAVVYSRKIWAQDCLPLFSLVVLGGLYEVCAKGNRRWFLPAAVSAGLMPGIHFSGFAALAVFGIFMALFRPRVGWRLWALAAAILLLIYSPFIAFVGTKASMGKAIADPRLSLASVAYAGQIMAHFEFDYLLGRSSAGFRQMLSPAVALGATVSGAVLVSLFVVGFLRLAVGSILRLRGRVAEDAGKTLCWVWVTVPVLGYLALSMDKSIYPHYWIVLYPVQFWLAADIWDRILEWAGERWRRVGGLLLAGAALTQVLFIVSFFGFLHKEGGGAGDYGVAYRHKFAAAEYVASAGTGATPPTLRSPARSEMLEYDFLAGWRQQARGWSPASDGPEALEFVILEWDGGAGVVDARELARAERFGPLKVLRAVR